MNGGHDAGQSPASWHGDQSGDPKQGQARAGRAGDLRPSSGMAFDADRRLGIRLDAAEGVARTKASEIYKESPGFHESKGL